MSQATVWVNKQNEIDLRAEGYEIPTYPETGPVVKDGQTVGHIDNFNGLVIKDKSFIPDLKRIMPTAGFWNC